MYFCYTQPIFSPRIIYNYQKIQEKLEETQILFKIIQKAVMLDFNSFNKNFFISKQKCIEDSIQASNCLTINIGSENITETQIIKEKNSEFNQSESRNKQDNKKHKICKISRKIARQKPMASKIQKLIKKKLNTTDVAHLPSKGIGDEQLIKKMDGLLLRQVPDWKLLGKSKVPKLELRMLMQ